MYILKIVRVIQILLILGVTISAKRNNDSKKENTKKTTIIPSFDRASENVTVIIGNSVVLPCFISNLGDHKVAWIKVANMDILTIGDYKVTNDDRIKLVHGYVSDWSLSIQPVNEEDSGEYICQVNTEPQIITRVFLQVLLPPKINEEKSTMVPVPVKEGHTLQLYCHSEGIPTPVVSWYFRKRPSHHRNHEKSNQALVKPNEQVTHEGDTLIVKNITRAHSGIYECIANNSVPPAASRKIKVSVEFSPEIQLQSERVEQFIGLDARLECRIKSNPLVNHYWMKDDRVIENGLGSGLENSVLNNMALSSKYEIMIYNQNSNEYLTVSALTIKNINKTDFGLYRCFAVNSHNTTRAEVELKELMYRRPTATTKASVSRIVVFGKNNQVKHINSNYDINLNENVVSINSNKDYQQKHQKKIANTSKLSNLHRLETIKHLEEDYYDEYKNENLFNGETSSLKSVNSKFLFIFFVTGLFQYYSCFN